MLKTTVGQLLINSKLPPELRDYNRVLDKKALATLLRQVIDKYPDSYSDVSKKLMDVGREATFESGSQSFGLEELRPTAAVRMSRLRLNKQITQILRNKRLSEEQKRDEIILASSAEQKRLQGEIMQEVQQSGSPLGEQVISGSRGNPSFLKRLIGGDTLYVDHRDNTIPFPVQRSYSEGLSPAEFWAATYGARKGMIDVKLAVADTGYLGKQMAQLTHRLLVTNVDGKAPDNIRGYPVGTDDGDSEGALLAAPVAGYPRNTIITNKLLAELKNKGISRILVRSPLVGGPENGGVYARDVGVRERGVLSPLGEEVGIAAAQALGEKLTQGSLSSKHGGGIKGETRSVSGFAAINQLLQAPKVMRGVATHAQLDGTITDIVPAPAGGQYIMIGQEKHYVPPGYDIKVKRGTAVEAGDVLTNGIPHPAEIVKHKGIGEARRYFVDVFSDTYRESGMAMHRRNVELLTRGLINHVEILEEDDEHIPGDIVPYQLLESRWKPRAGFYTTRPNNALGKYLERPVLHYTIGTQIKPSMLPVFQEFGVSDVDVHDEPPPFQPTMVRAAASVTNDPDWLVRFLGSNQKKSLLDAVGRGLASDTVSTSYVPALATGVEFAKKWPKSVLDKP